jgi:hypothetical protein
MTLKKTSINIELVNIEDDGSHLLMNAFIQEIPIRLLIDTGASRTVFDEKRLREILRESEFTRNEKLSTGLGTNSMPTSNVIIRDFRLGDLTIESFPSILLDLRHVNESYEKLGYLAIDGVLGNDILVKYSATISYPKLTLSMSF